MKDKAVEIETGVTKRDKTKKQLKKQPDSKDPQLTALKDNLASQGDQIAMLLQFMQNVSPTSQACQN